jgi:replicative DNA helicase
MTEVPAQFDRHAEESVLGAMMRDVDVVWEVITQVTPADFYEPAHEQVALAIVALANASRPVDPIAVCDELSRRGEMKGVIDEAFVWGLTDAAPTTSNAGYWANIVQQKAVLRRLSQAAVKIGNMATGEGASVAEIVEQARQEVDRVSTATATTVRAVGDTFDEFVSGLEEKPRFVPSPWWELNELIGGFRSGSLIIIGARPAQGKSLVGLNIAMRLAQAGPVAYSSLEMGRDEITARMVAQTQQVHLSQLMNHNLSPDSWQRVAMAREALRGTPLFVSTSDQAATLAEVRSFARSIGRKAAKDRPMAGMVVDYLQLLSSGQREESRQLEVANFSRSLKLFAQDQKMPVVALSQLNRRVAKSAGRTDRPSADRPTMADLRESGAIEQDADMILLLHHDEKHKPNELEVIVEKHRHGRTGSVTLRWEGQFSRALSYEQMPPDLFGQPGFRN